MKTKLSIILLFVFTSSAFAVNLFSPQGNNEPWTPQQLLSPADLAKALNNPNLAQPIVFCVGPQAIIKGSIEIGPAMKKENLEKLKLKLDKLPKNASIVIYCGCCPYDRCPNIRPALVLLGSMQFKNYKLLDLPRNVKVDWIDPGYPVND